MRVELQIDANCEEPFAVLHISKLTPAVQEAIKILENEGIQRMITAQAEGKVFVIEPEMIEVIRTEGRELVLYSKSKERYLLSKPLYELEALLGNDFIRISKSAIINFRRIHHAEASFNGTMEVVMKNGIEEVITRSYKKQFKERLGV
ncbi:MAG: LytTR family DNA-binding domain-containing protein [Emergencia timonensis]|uniref:LytTR family DNA-binding domain-containing protein n=1 Tax=Emergencia timonensis TaxID=1776384 RepID=UPI0008329524|nr:LytTR family DNA-binding domain-containing protein [Emergencia timonensis]WNX87099.1 LytTR family DNA-binding domain-containing protein [Emergencia timonensis]